jgi:hypothetical protein
MKITTEGASFVFCAVPAADVCLSIDPPSALAPSNRRKWLPLKPALTIDSFIEK